jgi:hypothetical protein
LAVLEVAVMTPLRWACGAEIWECHHLLVLSPFPRWLIAGDLQAA